VVERYISGQKGYGEIEAMRGEGESGEGRGEKTGVMPVVVISEEKVKTHKTWYMTLYEKLFAGNKNKKPKSFYRPVMKK
jgi:hypothetical protein